MEGNPLKSSDTTSDDDRGDWPRVGDDDLPRVALGKAAPGAEVVPAVVGAPAVAAGEDLALALTHAHRVLNKGLSLTLGWQSASYVCWSTHLSARETTEAEKEEDF